MGHLRAFVAFSVVVATFSSPGLVSAQTSADAATAAAAVPQTVTFIGGGWGHAVGLSQYGAQGRALDGFTGEEIVTAYYTGTDVEATTALPLDPDVLGVERPLWVGLSQGHSSLPLGISSGNLTICFDPSCTTSLPAAAGESWVITYDGGRGGCTFTRNGKPILLPPPPIPPPPDDAPDDAGDAAPVSPPDENGGAGTGNEAAPPTEEAPPADNPPGEEPPADQAPPDQPPADNPPDEEPPADAPTEETPDEDPPADAPREEEPPPPPEPVVAPDCRLTIELDPGTVSTLDRQYGRGALELRKVPGAARFHVSASLDLDDYVYGITEVPTSWQTEALRAQALAARTFALNRFLRYEDVSRRAAGDPGLDSSSQSRCWCHVVDGSADQVYKGLEGEATSWVSAADTTAGRVITYRGPDAGSFTRANVIEALYSSSNGGVSESNTSGFGSSTLYPYLVPVDDHYSIIEAVNNPLATWELEVDVATVLDKIGKVDNAGDPAWEQLITVQVLEGPPEGLVRFEGIDRGQYVTEDVPGWQMRRTFGLRSPQVYDTRLEGNVCANHFPTIVGSKRSEHITGTYGKDVIFGYGGDDTIEGLGGDDVICAGTGDDVVRGGFGADIIYGGAGNDTLHGDSSHDTIFGGEGLDFIDGGFGNDSLRGDNSFDLIYGGGGRDDVDGGAGDDVIHGDAGRDVLRGGPDADHLFGGAHADLLSGQQGDDDMDGGTADDECRGGQGIDTATRCEVVSWVP